MSTLERAVALAAESHAGQVDKAGAHYLLQCLRVMLADLRHDCDLGRIPSPTRRDHERVERFRRAIAQLEGGRDEEAASDLDRS